MNQLKYQMVIQWSDEDNCFFVGSPDFLSQQWRTHRDTYQEAVDNGIEALESLILALRPENRYQKLLFITLHSKYLNRLLKAAS